MFEHKQFNDSEKSCFLKRFQNLKPDWLGKLSLLPCRNFFRKNYINKQTNRNTGFRSWDMELFLIKYVSSVYKASVFKDVFSHLWDKCLFFRQSSVSVKLFRWIDTLIYQCSLCRPICASIFLLRKLVQKRKIVVISLSSN